MSSFFTIMRQILTLGGRGRDIRVTGAQKSDSQEMSAANYLLFWGANFLKKQLWAGSPSCAHYFIFFLRRFFLTKKNMGEITNEFVLFSAWSQYIVPVLLLEVGFYEVVHEAPIFRTLFFLFWIFPKKSRAVRPRCAHQFFFPPLTLKSLEGSTFKIVSPRPTMNKCYFAQFPQR